jgi:hypothetical protein
VQIKPKGQQNDFDKDHKNTKMTGGGMKDTKKIPYTENPKTAGSGIVCAIPQTGPCPNGCEDCFFQSGRSYLEPLADHLPNLPPVAMTINKVVRINDGNDSNVRRSEVMAAAGRYALRFYNTAIPDNLDGFDAPVVLTVNPGPMTDTAFHRLAKIPPNLMFVRVRTNTWNIDAVVKPAVAFYASGQVPVVLTFMAYYRTAVPQAHRTDYILRKRTLNRYQAIRTAAWRRIMRLWEDTPAEKWVYSCGKVEGEGQDTSCKRCGNCLREYFAAMERRRTGV